MIQGLDWVREHYEAPAVVVMALGGEAQYALDLAVHDLARAGVSVLVAAGNEDTDACTKSPARCLPQGFFAIRAWPGARLCCFTPGKVDTKASTKLPPRHACMGVLAL